MQQNTESLVLHEGKKLSLVCGYPRQDAGDYDKGGITDAVSEGAWRDARMAGHNEIQTSSEHWTD
jgi:hypothetical protein